MRLPGGTLFLVPMKLQELPDTGKCVAAALLTLVTTTTSQWVDFKTNRRKFNYSTIASLGQPLSHLSKACQTGLSKAALKVRMASTCVSNGVYAD